MFLPQPQSLLDTEGLHRRVPLVPVSTYHAPHPNNSSSPYNNVSPLQPSPQQCSVSSRELKFGMDRILSGDLASTKNQVFGGGSPPREGRQFSPVTVSSGPTVPCSECVSSLLRCCGGPGGPGCHSPPRTVPEPSHNSGPSPLASPLALSAAPAPGGVYSYYSTLNHLHHPPMAHFTSIFSAESHHAALLHHGSPKHAVSGAASSSSPGTTAAGAGKRKRSWSRAVFSNLQRKGLEKRFQLQKYITKPDRRQLAATLGLTDAQVKVWFQNRRMKWRHSKEAKQVTVPETRSATSEEARGPGTVEETGRRPDSTQRDVEVPANLMEEDDNSDEDIEVDS